MAKRRKRGTGSIHLRKDGRWEGRCLIGYDEKGLPKTKNVLAKTKSECIEKLKALQQTLTAPTPSQAKVTASCGRGRRVTRSWHPEAGWSRKTIERELNKFAATLENSLQSNEVVTRQEQIEIDRKAAIEAAKLKTLRQYADCVFMPAKEATFSENARSSYRMFLDKHIFPILGDELLTEISPAMLTKLLLDFQKAGYAHATTIKLYNVLNGIFQMAFLDDTIPINPMLKVKRPTPRKAEQIETVEQAYTVDEMQYIFSCLEKEPLKDRKSVV